MEDKEKFGEGWDKLDEKGKKELIDLIKKVEEHKVMHPLGTPFKISGYNVYLISNNINKCGFVYENAKKNYHFSAHSSKTKKGQSLWKAEKGFVYEFDVHSPERDPNKVLNAILSEEEFSTLFRRTKPVNEETNKFTIETVQVLTKKTMAKALGLAIQRAGKAYKLKVTKLNQIKFEDRNAQS
jgi:hypothetical protein